MTIEDGDFDYVFLKRNDEMYREGFLEFFNYSTKTEYIKGIIEDKQKRNEYGLRESVIKDLIVATEDDEYKKRNNSK